MRKHLVISYNEETCPGGEEHQAGKDDQGQGPANAPTLWGGRTPGRGGADGDPGLPGPSSYSERQRWRRKPLEGVATTHGNSQTQGFHAATGCMAAYKKGRQACR